MPLNKKANKVKKDKLSRLLNLFNLGMTDDKKDIRPIRHFETKEGRVVKFEDFPSVVQKLMNYWQTQCHDNAASFENRKLLFQDMDLLYQNSPLLSRAMKLMAHEVVQADSNFRVVDVEAQPRIRDFILEFFDNVGLEKLLLPTALSIVKYGNAGWILSNNDHGIDEILPIDIYDLFDRIEFTPHEVRKQMKDINSVTYRMSQNQKMKMLIDNVMKTENYSSYFKAYLFGFQVADFIIPPWKFLHFRNFTNESPFYPFGIPPFINAISAYRQYDAANTLQVAARAAKFPIYKYKLTLGPNVPATEKLERAIEFMNEFDNSGLHGTRKEEFGVGERMVTIDGAWEFEQETPDIDLGRIDDIEMMRDDLIIATGLPRNFLDPNNGSFGNSGIALVQQFRPFAREVYNLQSIMLDNFTQMVKVHMILSGKFNDEDIDFQLTMPYPESQTDRELIGAQTDLLGLANNILDNIAQRIVGDPQAILPPELIKQVYSSILPYDTQRIDDWVRAALLSKQEKEEGVEETTGEETTGGGTGAEAGGGEQEGLNLGGEEEGAGAAPAETAPAGGGGGAGEKAESLKREIKSTLAKKSIFFETRQKLKEKTPTKLKEDINAISFEEKQKVVRNAKIAGKHNYSSKNLYEDFSARQLWDFKEKRVELLQENLQENFAEFNKDIENPLPSEEEINQIDELLVSEEEPNVFLDNLELDGENV